MNNCTDTALAMPQQDQAHQDQTHQEQTRQELATGAGPVQGNPGQLLPAKREHDDDVQFISSQPIKKMRLMDPVPGDDSQPCAAPAPHPDPEGNTEATDEASKPDRAVSAMPLGLPSHLSADLVLENRGASLPAMENFSFSTPFSGPSSRPPTSTAVSPRQLPQTISPNVVHRVSGQPGHESSPPGMTIDQISCLDVRVPLNSSNTNASDNSNQMQTMASMNAMSSMSGTSSVSSMPGLVGMANPSLPNFMSSDASSAGGSTLYQNYPQPGYVPLNTQAPVPFATYSMANMVPIPQVPSSLNSTMMGMSGSQGLQNGQPFNPQTAVGMGGYTSTQLPNWASAQGNYSSLQHAQTSLIPQVPMTSLNSEYRGSSSQQMVPQKRPCLACAAARKQGCHTPFHGQPLGVRPQGPQGPQLTQPSQGPLKPIVSGLQNQVYPLGPVRSAVNMDNAQDSGIGDGISGRFSAPSGAPQAVAPDSRATDKGLPGPLPHSGPGPFAIAGRIPATAQISYHSGAGIGHDKANSSTPFFNPVLTTGQATMLPSIPHSVSAPRPSAIRQQTPPVPPPAPSSHSHTPKPAATQQQPHPIQPPKQPPQANPPTRPQSPAAAAAATAAATLASTRKKHAANLLVDVAELALRIFPFDIVARQHGTLPRKVAEALAAVVQVPLLRCASDKRRAGKLGADRMREYREGRKGWVAMVREWEREEKKSGERDAEGERDDGVGLPGGQGNGNGAPVGNGEPSALDVALLLAPTEMPALMLKEGFFTGL